VMLVDLGRNDLGRVCEYNSVRVSEMMVIERYSHVMHIVSHVVGKLREGMNAFDVIRACFPAGTLSGAPKIRAMEIIDELEPTRRGPYGGAVGYFSFSGSADTAITIRTLVVKDGVAYVQAGGGIVADSVPETEYQETVNKARAVLRAIELAEAGWSRRKGRMEGKEGWKVSTGSTQGLEVPLPSFHPSIQKMSTYFGGNLKSAPGTYQSFHDRRTEVR